MVNEEMTSSYTSTNENNTTMSICIILPLSKEKIFIYYYEEDYIDHGNFKLFTLKKEEQYREQKIDKIISI